jgi:predicted PurR-regulated permease PerM
VTKQQDSGASAEDGRPGADQDGDAPNPAAPKPAAPIPAAPGDDLGGPAPHVAAQGPDGVAKDGPAAHAHHAGWLSRFRALRGPAEWRSRYDVPPEPDVPSELPGTEAVASAVRHPIRTGFLLTVGVGLALLGFFVLTNVGQLVVWIAIALFIALGLDPVVRWIERRGLPRPVGVLTAILLLVGAMGAVFGTLIPTIVSQTGQFVEDVPGFIDEFLNSDFFRTLDSQFQVRERLTEEVDKFFQNPNNVGGLFGGVIGAGTVIAQGMFGTLTVLVLAIYFLASLPAMKAWAYRLAPRSSRAKVQQLSEQISSSVGYYVMGQGVVALLNATYAFIVMTLVGVPFSTLLALVVAMLAFVPLVGAVVAGILVSLVALTVGWETATLYAILYFGYLQFEAYFISPRIMQRAVAVPGSVAVIAVIAGGALMGIAGALMAIPMAAAAMLLLREVFIVRQDRL